MFPFREKLSRWLRSLRAAKRIDVVSKTVLFGVIVSIISIVLRRGSHVPVPDQPQADLNDHGDAFADTSNELTFTDFKGFFRKVEGVTIDCLDVKTGRTLEIEGRSVPTYAYSAPIGDSATVAKLIAQRCSPIFPDYVRVVIRDGDNHVAFGGKTLGEVRRSFTDNYY